MIEFGTTFWRNLQEFDNIHCVNVMETVKYQGRRSLWDRGTRPPQYLDWGDIIMNVHPQYFWSNISYFLTMQYFLEKFKKFLVFLVFSRLVQGVVGTL